MPQNTRELMIDLAVAWIIGLVLGFLALPMPAAHSAEAYKGSKNSITFGAACTPGKKV